MKEVEISLEERNKDWQAGDRSKTFEDRLKLIPGVGE
jgi:hypothetical protein